MTDTTTQAQPRLTSKLNVFYQLTLDLSLQQDLVTLLRLIMERAIILVNATEGVISLYDSKTQELVVAVAKDFPIQIGSRLPWNATIAEAPCESPQAYPPDLQTPMRYQGELIGVLGVSRSGNARTKFTRTETNLLFLFSGYAASAIHNAHLLAETKRDLKKFQALRDIDTAITSDLDVSTMLNVLLKQITFHLKVNTAVILLYNPHTQALEYAAGIGQPTMHTETTFSYAGLAMRARRNVSITDFFLAETDVEPISAEDLASYLGVPLISKDQVKGVLEIFDHSLLDRDAEWFDFLDALATQLAIAIDNALLFSDLQRSNRELKTSYRATLEVLSKALELRDFETEGHCERVTELTSHLAQRLGIDGPDLIHMEYGALLHDIGKIGIPDTILFKPGALTEEEWSIMREHPINGYKLLSAIPFLKPALDIPLYHHEHWNGRGYPHGLVGEAIPLAARIFTVVDVWDALLSDRPYRKAWPIEKAIEYILLAKGKQFDPKVVDGFLAFVCESASKLLYAHTL